jgi:prepilin-type N-terminal cleavage/methylation domain-containing protein
MPGSAGPRPAPAAPRRAFTLIEMLIVIGIMLTLMGLGAASVVSQPRLQRMVAAEQVVADAIRQARHTARTSGQPVVLELRRAERSISGLMRQPLWHQVDGWPEAEANDGTAWVRFPQPGRTGTGLHLPNAYTENGVLPATPARAVITDAALTGGLRLWRGQAQPDPEPGLLLSLAVRPPVARSGSPRVIPLALVADPDAGTASFDQSVLGLALVLSTSGTATSGPQSSKGRNRFADKVVDSWEIVGWFGPTPRIEISSITDKPKDQDAYRQDKEVTIIRYGAGGSQELKEFTESQALVGGRWTEISLLVEPDRLVLYRDGRRVGEVARTQAISLPTPATERVWVGVATLDAGTATVPSGTIIDDVLLERLGGALAGTLPGGVRFDQDRRITCHPDGRVEVDATGVTATPDSTPISISAETGERADLTIDAGGAVSSRTVSAALERAP